MGSASRPKALRSSPFPGGKQIQLVQVCHPLDPQPLQREVAWLGAGTGSAKSDGPVAQSYPHRELAPFRAAPHPHHAPVQIRQRAGHLEGSQTQRPSVQLAQLAAIQEVRRSSRRCSNNPRLEASVRWPPVSRNEPAPLAAVDDERPAARRFCRNWLVHAPRLPPPSQGGTLGILRHCGDHGQRSPAIRFGMHRGNQASIDVIIKWEAVWPRIQGQAIATSSVGGGGALGRQVTRLVASSCHQTPSGTELGFSGRRSSLFVEDQLVL